MPNLLRNNGKKVFNLGNHQNDPNLRAIYRWALGPAKNNQSARNPNKSRKARRKAQS